MENQRITLIGGGNMAEAILKGILGGKKLSPEDITVCDIDAPRLSYLQEKYGVSTTAEARQAIDASPVVILAVKPNVIGHVLRDNQEALRGKAVASIVAGWSTGDILDLTGEDVRVLRIMPNTPALVGAGMSVLCSENTLLPGEYALIESIFSVFGSVLCLPEKYFNAVTAVSGSGPAYVFMFIEALADGGVKQGLPRSAAVQLAAQTVLGSARMVLETGIHPGALKDAVCSPGGTTIEAVFSLEKNGFRGSVMEAVDECAKKAGQLK